ncbi:uncharacterized protein LOC100371751 [Saccoglossus kowalevskii]|uniref:Uncharacterized protein LOC100371751 n=1 Tax=Saccoglossus kowalevskii TaxID=10224 RepID=A0ABM0GI83_SACKO|nr:PREDICTED: uncharacterized protein LOC100371751 [Saccoglossus kowalevskii]
MIVKQLIFGLSILAFGSCDTGPGNPSDDSCVLCNHAFFPKGEWNGECTEEVPCPEIMNNAGDTAEKKDVLFKRPYFIVDVPFEDNTRTYRYVAFEASVLDSVDAPPKGEGRSVANCQFCMLDIRKGNWVTTDCKFITCPAQLSDSVAFKLDDDGAADRVESFCRVDKEGQSNHYTCYWVPNIETLVSNLIAGS